MRRLEYTRIQWNESAFLFCGRKEWSKGVQGREQGSLLTFPYRDAYGLQAVSRYFDILPGPAELGQYLMES